MSVFCAHCGVRLMEEARFCTACGRPAEASPQSAPAGMPPLPAAPPAPQGAVHELVRHTGPSTVLGLFPAQQVSGVLRVALKRLSGGDWATPARIAVPPTAVLLLLAVAAAASADASWGGFGDAFLVALALVMSAFGAHPGIELTTGQPTPLASSEIAVVPLGVTLLWAVALWFGAARYCRRAGAADSPPTASEVVLLCVRSVLLAVLGAVLLASVAGTSIPLPGLESSEETGLSTADLLLGDANTALSMTCSPVRAAWWTLLLASAVLLPTLRRTAMSEWAGRKPLLGDWLSAARRAVAALAVSLALATAVTMILVLSNAGLSSAVPGLLLAPNLATALLGTAWGASTELTTSSTGFALPGTPGLGAPATLSLFELHDLSAWAWASVLLGVVTAIVLGASTLRDGGRSADALRTLICFVTGFLLLALTSGITADLSFNSGSSDLLASLLGDDLGFAVSGNAHVHAGLVLPGALLAATLWAGLGAFGIPAAARRLGVTTDDIRPRFTRSLQPRSTPLSAPAANAIPTPGVPDPLEQPLGAAQLETRPASGNVATQPGITEPARPTDTEPPRPDEQDVPDEDSFTQPDQHPTSPEIAAVPPKHPRANAVLEELPTSPPAAQPRSEHSAPPEAGAAAVAPAPAALPTPLPELAPALPTERPRRRRWAGWKSVAATIVGSAVMAAGATTAAMWRTADQPNPAPHTQRAAATPVEIGSPAPETSAPFSVPTGPGTSPSASQVAPQGIATQVESLLEENKPLRGHVQDAITAAKHCWNGAEAVRDARDELLVVAVHREDLVRRLDLLTPQADGDMAKALADLSRGWTASAQADRDYASWASDTVDFMTPDPLVGCPKNGAVGADYEAAGHNREATKAKKDFANRWNALAHRYGLTVVDPTDL